ncbi:hypothetical protein BISU_0375 [Bifidobacterium subtile]|jgi:hypothetical protein|uniref:Uncharacterized protein n=1 Tax=Bifidobacterium subtile TaxID=77635 RepID=A0A087E7Z8_9BIFI|nr:hypothetical protein BISU_0375 [Bifidobacterium subtile]
MQVRHSDIPFASTNWIRFDGSHLSRLCAAPRVTCTHNNAIIRLMQRTFRRQMGLLHG